jgi:hypothetical protein
MDKNETYRKIIEGCRAMADLLEEELKGSIETAPKAEAEKKAEKKTVALEDVRAALSAKSSAGLSSQVRMLLGLHSAKKLSEVKKEEYELLLAQAEKLELLEEISKTLGEKEKNGLASIFPALFEHHYATSLADLKPDYYESFLRDAKELNDAQ